MARPPPEQSIEDSDPRTPSSGPSTPRSPSAKIYASQSSPDRLKDVKTVRVLGDSSAPGERHEGATAIEDENLIEIRLKDLDSGKEFTILKKEMIRDLSTGRLYALSKDSDSGQGFNGSAGKESFTDFASGRQLSLDEFDIAVGIKQESKANSILGVSNGREGTAADQAPPGRKKGWLNLMKLKKKNNKGNIRDSECSDSESATSTHQGDEAGLARGSLGRSSEPASVSGRSPIRVQVHRKLHKDLAELCHVQTLPGHQGVVWAMKFSHDGKFLATAGQDRLVFIWKVKPGRGEDAAGPSSAEANSPGKETEQPRNGSNAGSPSTPESQLAVFETAPHRKYKGHQQDVLDVAWSKSFFLLSASMDKCVRLWHVSMDECLRVFRHTDFVTALDFHPIDDKHFVSGSIDGKVRIWNIPEQHGRVVDYADVHEMVTATTFSADGSRAIVGTMKGKCRFYQCGSDFKLEYQAQIDVKNRRGKASKGRKITGIQHRPNDPSMLLITSNDSRIRLYNGYTLQCKYKGLHNTSTQIRASFSEGGDFILCGSDDGLVYLWSTRSGQDTEESQASSQASTSPASQEKSGSYEYFHAHDDIATVAIFAPQGARRCLVPPSPRPSEKIAGSTESMSRLGLRSKFSKEEAAGAATAGQAAIASAKAYGQVILTAGYDGAVKVFENISPPHWL